MNKAQKTINYTNVVKHIKDCFYIHERAEKAYQKELCSVWHVHNIDLNNYEEVSKLEENIKLQAISDFLRELEKEIYYCEKEGKENERK